jgi:predicted MFS family arabinose efflux permease
MLPFAVLCSVPFVMVLGNSMLIPILPKIKSALDLSQIQTGLIITAFSVPAGLVILFVGILSDRIGRKEVISPALIIYGLGGAGAALAGAFLKKSYPIIIAARVVQGIGAAGTAPIAIALTGDIFQSEERSKAQGLLEASNGLGKVLSPVLGAGSGLLSWWAPLMIAAILTRNPETVEALVAAGAEVNARDDNSWTPLMGAAAFNQEPDVIRALIAAGADINARHESKWNTYVYPMLHLLTLENVKAEIAKSIKSGTAGEGGLTPLMNAARYNDGPEVIEVLLDAGADGKLKSNEGKTAFDYAEENPRVKDSEAYSLLKKACN